MWPTAAVVRALDPIVAVGQMVLGMAVLDMVAAMTPMVPEVFLAKAPLGSPHSMAAALPAVAAQARASAVFDRAIAPAAHPEILLPAVEAVPAGEPTAVALEAHNRIVAEVRQAPTAARLVTREVAAQEADTEVFPEAVAPLARRARSILAGSSTRTTWRAQEEAVAVAVARLEAPCPWA